MKLFKSLLPFLFAASLLLGSCIKDPQFEPATIGVCTESIDFTSEAGSFQFHLMSNRDWKAQITSGTGTEVPTWIALSDTLGSAMKDSLLLTISVLPNEGIDRQATINFKTETIYASVRVSQKGTVSRAVTYFADDFSSITEANKAYDANGWKTYSSDASDVYYGWRTGLFTTDGSKYLQIAPYQSSQDQVVAYAAMPLFNVADATAKTLQFDVAIYYVTEDASKLEVVASTDYQEDLSAATWTVVYDATFAAGATKNTWKTHTVDLTAKYGSTKEVTFAFRYTGKSNTYRLDNVKFGKQGGGGGGGSTEGISVEQLVTYIKTNLASEASGSLAAAGKFVKGIVAANNDEGNLSSSVSIVDASGNPNSGIILYNSSITGLAVGDSVKVALDAAVYKNYNGLREVTWETFDATYITKINSGNSFTVPEITAAQVNTDNYQGMYVKIKDLTSDNAEGAKWNDGSTGKAVNTSFKDASGTTVAVRTSTGVAWANSVINTGVTASLSGVAEIYTTTSSSTVQVFPTKEEDIEGFSAPSGPTFTINPTTKTVTSAAGSFTISVRATEGVDWTVTSNNSNFTVSPASGTKNGTVTVTYTENTSETDARNATITFVTTATTITNKTLTCAVTQSKKGGSGGAGVYTSNVDITSNISAGTWCYAYNVTIEGTSDTYNGLKIGKSQEAGSYTTPALGATGTKTLTFYAVAWNAKTCDLTITVNGGGTIGGGASKVFTLTPNAGTASTQDSATLAFGSSDFYTVELSGITASSTLTLATSASGTRAVILGMNIN